jgi:hypothetical protein
MNVTLETLVSEGVCREGDEVSVVGTENHGSCQVAKAKKSGYGLSFEVRNPNDKNYGKFVTVPNPTALVRRLLRDRLKEDHVDFELATKKGLNGWSFCVHDRRKQTLQRIKEHVKSKLLAKSLKDGENDVADDVDSDDELEEESLCEVANFRINRQEDKHDYDSAVESLRMVVMVPSAYTH